MTLRLHLPLALVAATTSCLNEYHPEYHPESSSSFAQNVSYPTSVFASPPPPPLEVVCPPGTATTDDQCVRTEVVTDVVKEVSCPEGFAWDKAHRSCVARVDTSCSLGMRFQSGVGCVQAPYAALHKTPGMVSIPGGAFWMGRLDGDVENDDVPRRVAVKAFEMDQVDVSITQYDQCVRARSCTPVPAAPVCRMSPAENGDHPARCVTWIDASAYCAWAGKRLPTEEEWEYAVRGVDARKYPWGNEEPTVPRDLVCAQPFSVWAHASDAEYATTCPVGAFPAGASPAGVLDMSGNVWQWVASAYCAGCGSDRRALRGGDYHAVQSLTARRGDSPSAWAESYGFRCAR